MTFKQACEGWSIFWFGIFLINCESRLTRTCFTPLFHNWIVLSSWPPNIQKDFTCLVVCESRLKSFLSDFQYMWSRLVLLCTGFIFERTESRMSHACNDDPYEADGVNQHLHWYLPKWALFKVIFILRNVKFRFWASPLVLSMWPCKNIYFSYSSLVIYFFATPQINLKLGLQTCGNQ
jgi:hypothetical protein